MSNNVTYQNYYFLIFLSMLLHIWQRVPIDHVVADMSNH